MPEVFKGVVQAEHFGEHPDFGAGTAVYGKGQDGYLLCPELKLIAVADGMGGHDGGTEAVEEAFTQLEKALPLKGASFQEVDAHLREILLNVCLTVKGDKSRWPDGGGSTFGVAMQIPPEMQDSAGGTNLALWHTGDVRWTVVNPSPFDDPFLHQSMADLPYADEAWEEFIKDTDPDRAKVLLDQLPFLGVDSTDKLKTVRDFLAFMSQSGRPPAVVEAAFREVIEMFVFMKNILGGSIGSHAASRLKLNSRCLTVPDGSFVFGMSDGMSEVASTHELCHLSREAANPVEAFQQAFQLGRERNALLTAHQPFNVVLGRDFVQEKDFSFSMLKNENRFSGPVHCEDDVVVAGMCVRDEISP